MGVVQRPSLKMYWVQDPLFKDSFVPNAMSRDRFLDILYNIHWLDATQMTPAERAQRNRADGFWTVEEFLQLLGENFANYFECGRILSIDEMAIFFKGRHTSNDDECELYIKCNKKQRTDMEYWSNNYEFRSTGCHVPVRVSRYYENDKLVDPRGKCKMCKAATVGFKCATCNVNLCITEVFEAVLDMTLLIHHS
eukprot:gene7783-10573_t